MQVASSGKLGHIYQEIRSTSDEPVEEEIRIRIVRDSEERYKGILGGILTIQVVQNDITSEVVDAITNAANEKLDHGHYGVAGAIARNGGEEVILQSRAWIDQHGDVPTGQCAHTGPGRLKCKYIIHTVGP